MSKPYAEINLGQYGVHKFLSKEELFEWWSEQSEPFRNFQLKTQNVKLNNALTQKFNALFNDVQTPINQLRQADEPTEPARLSNVITAISQSFAKQPHLIDSSSSQAKFLNDVEEQHGFRVSAGALSWFMGCSLVADTDSFAGAFLALQFEHGVIETAHHEKESLAELVQEFREVIAASKRQTAANKGKWNQFIGDADSQIQTQAEQFQTMLSDSKTDLQTIEKLYSDKLALQASVKYWSDKKEDHETKTKTFAWATGGIAVVLFVAVAVLMGSLLGEDKLAELPAWSISTSFIALTFAVWVVRVLLRILLSHMHSAADASERATMILTFLALLRDENAIEAGDRRVILDALFRPSNFGLIKEETVSPFEWINRSRDN